MRGKPLSNPNHVLWPNGFKSNMPDWMTARECAHVDEALAALKQARKVLLDAVCTNYSDIEVKHITEMVVDVIDKMTGMDTIGREDRYMSAPPASINASPSHMPRFIPGEEVGDHVEYPPFPSLPKAGK